jgi:hypothetical protein
VGIGAGFPHPSRKASATSYLCETGFWAVATIRTQYHSMMNRVNDLRVTTSKLQPRLISNVQRGNHTRPTNPGMKSIFYLSVLN